VSHKSAIPTFVTAMPWEKRKRGGRYYTRSYRDKDGRVRREYIGTGELARIVSEQDTIRRAAQVAERERQRAEVERLEELAAPVLELDEAAEVLARAHLVAGGYRRHKGEWRLRRGRSA
jgi:hypothetical protein